LEAIVTAMAPDMLQLHGGESPQRVRELRTRYGLPVIKALPVRARADLERAADHAGIADFLLFDAKPPKGADLPGGNGVAFDWRLLEDFDPATPYFLSGGLNAGNVSEALAVARPSGIDISSGVETAPGVKDVRLIEAFFRALAAGTSRAA